MENLEWGLRKGLAVVLPDESENMWKAAAYKSAMKDKAEAKAKMFADDFSYTNAINSFDNPKIKEFARNQIMKVGEFINNNPGWETNPLLRGQYQMMVHELKDNPDLMRGLTSDAAYKRWQEDMASNKEGLDPEDFNETSDQWQNYLQYGNQMGKEAAEKFGKQEFKYVAPMPFNGEAVVVDSASHLEKIERALTKQDYKGAIGLGATASDVSFERAYETAKGLLTNSKNQRGFAKEWAKMSDNNKAALYNNDMTAWVAERIKTKKGMDISTGTFPSKKGGDGDGSDGNGVFNYLYDVALKESGTSNFLEPLFNFSKDVTTGKNVYQVPAKGFNIGQKVEGKDGTTSLQFMNVAGMIPVGKYEAYAGTGIETQDGVKHGQMTIKVPLNKAMTQGKNALFKDTAWILDPDKEDYEEIPAMANIATLERDADGEPTGYALINTYNPLGSSRANIQGYNILAGGQAAANKQLDVTMNALQKIDQMNYQNAVIQAVNKKLKTEGGTAVRLKDGRIQYTDKKGKTEIFQ